jgi:hypothetical protein
LAQEPVKQDARACELQKDGFKYEETEKLHTNPVPVYVPSAIQAWSGDGLALAEHGGWTVTVQPSR